MGGIVGRLGRYHLAACWLALLAIGLHFGALRARDSAMGARARAVTASREQEVVLQVASDRSSRWGERLAHSGLAIAAAAALCLFLSFRRHEPAPWRSVPMALLFGYVLLQFVIV